MFTILPARDRSISISLTLYRTLPCDNWPYPKSQHCIYRTIENPVSNILIHASISKKTHISANLKQLLEFIKEMVRVIRFLSVLCPLGLRCRLAERISSDSISHLPSSFFVIIISMSEFRLCDTRGNLKQTNATQV